MSKLLISDRPIMIIPSLAVKIGLNEAVILQQIHYWVMSSIHVIEGRKWIYNSYKEWQNQLPFWSESTIKRTIHSLEDQGYLISGNWNNSKMDKTKWYTIDYERIEALDALQHEPSIAQHEPSIVHYEPSIAQNEPSNMSEWHMEDTNLNQAIPESTTESTSEKKIHVIEIINYLNEKTNTSYKPSRSKTQEVIRARVREGFTVEDFKRVIDLKTAEWLKDPHMSKYLRPETLFGTKFESYLNQKSFKNTTREEDFDLDD
jgi:uncharacterized phage protein (TIGR02220 family)